jgi:hypothetical protein
MNIKRTNLEKKHTTMWILETVVVKLHPDRGKTTTCCGQPGEQPEKGLADKGGHCWGHTGKTECRMWSQYS